MSQDRLVVESTHGAVSAPFDEERAVWESLISTPGNGGNS